MNAHDIKAELAKRGYTMSDLARELDVSPQAVSYIVYGVHRSRRIEELIAARSGHPLNVLWPQWYGDQAA